MKIDNTQLMWKFYVKFKKWIRLVYEISSFSVLLMSFENAYKLKTWSVVKPWQIARLSEKLPRLFKTLSKTFATA